MVAISNGKRVSGVPRKDLVQKRITNSAGIETTVYVRPEGAYRPSQSLRDTAMPVSSAVLSGQQVQIIGRYETLSGIANDIDDDALRHSAQGVLEDTGGTDYEYLTAVRDKLEVLNETEIASDHDAYAMDDLNDEIELLLDDTPYSESITGGATSADCEWVSYRGHDLYLLASPNREGDGAFAKVERDPSGDYSVWVQAGGSLNGYSAPTMQGVGAVRNISSWSRLDIPSETAHDAESAKKAAESYVDAVSRMDINSDEFIDFVGPSNHEAFASAVGRGANLNNVEVGIESETDEYLSRGSRVGYRFVEHLRAERFDEASNLARQCGLTRLSDRVAQRNI